MHALFANLSQNFTETTNDLERQIKETSDKFPAVKAVEDNLNSFIVRTQQRFE